MKHNYEKDPTEQKYLKEGVIVVILLAVSIVLLIIGGFIYGGLYIQ